MQLSSSQADGISQIIREASKNPLGVVVALVLMVGGLAYVYFGKERTQRDGRLLIYRFAAFVLVFIGAVAVVWLVASLPRGVTHAHDLQTAKPATPTRPARDQSIGQGGVAKNNISSGVTREFISQIELARMYSGLTDYPHACGIYSTAFGSLPDAALSRFERETVSVESRKCGKGRSQEAVERLDGIAMRFSVD
jgi:hypothetical protein